MRAAEREVTGPRRSSVVWFGVAACALGALVQVAAASTSRVLVGMSALETDAWLLAWSLFALGRVAPEVRLPWGTAIVAMLFPVGWSFAPVVPDGLAYVLHYAGIVSVPALWMLMARRFRLPGAAIGAWTFDDDVHRWTGLGPQWSIHQQVESLDEAAWRR